MKEVVLQLDVQLNDNEDWLAEGTKLKVSNNLYHLSKEKGYTPVIVDSALTYSGDLIEFSPYIEWFANECFENKNKNNEVL